MTFKTNALAVIEVLANQPHKISFECKFLLSVKSVDLRNTIYACEKWDENQADNIQKIEKEKKIIKGN